VISAIFHFFLRQKRVRLLTSCDHLDV